MHFAVDASGLLQVTKGEAVFETTEEYTVKVRSHIHDLTCFVSDRLSRRRSSCRPFWSEGWLPVHKRANCMPCDL